MAAGADNPTAADPRDRARRLAELAQRAAGAYGRPDLADRAGELVRRLALDDVPVLVVGEFKQGKSSLVNALLGSDVCPVDDDLATAAAVVVRNGPEPTAQVHLRPPPPTGAADEPGADDEVVDVPIDDLAAWASEAGNPGNRRRVRRVEVALPHRILATGLTFVDTPGVGGLGSVHSAATVAALAWADAVLFVSDATQELTASEVAFLGTVHRLCPEAALVLTKCDLQPEWRRILDLDRAHLGRAGLDLPVLAVSSAVRRHAASARDARANDESGFPALLGWLGGQVRTAGAARVVGSAARMLGDLVDQLELPLASEQEALVDPATAGPLVARLEDAQRRAAELRSGAAVWARTLGDQFGDLSADLDHDLRARMRALQVAADERIDASDPADTWADSERAVQQEVAASMAAHYEVLVGRVEAALVAVAEAFGDAAPDVAAGFGGVARFGEVGDGDLSADVARVKASTQALSLLRSSYGGVAMFGFFGNMAGLVLATPALVAVGLVLGSRALRDERERQLAQRRSQAKAAVRRYLDEVSFAVGKDSRDAVRRSQRDVRDHLLARAGELERAAAEALEAVRQAQGRAEAERAARAADLGAELERLTKLRTHIDALAASVGGGASL